MNIFARMFMRLLITVGLLHLGGILLDHYWENKIIETTPMEDEDRGPIPYGGVEMGKQRF